MKAIKYGEVKANLAKIIDQVIDDHNPTIIVRSNARSAVLISLEDYQTLEETAYLLNNPQNGLRLLESIHELEAHHNN